MSDTTIVCPYCKQKLVTEDDVQGVSIECPSCRKTFAVAAIPVFAPPVMASTRPAVPMASPRVPTMSGSIPAKTEEKSSVLKAGWICFSLGMILMVVMFFIPVWGALLLASLIMGIIAAAQSQKGGIALIITTLVAPPILATIILLIVIGGCVAAVDSEMKKQGVQFPWVPPTTQNQR